MADLFGHITLLMGIVSIVSFVVTAASGLKTADPSVFQALAGLKIATAVLAGVFFLFGNGIKGL